MPDNAKATGRSCCWGRYLRLARPQCILAVRNDRPSSRRERFPAGVSGVGDVSVDRDAMARASLPHRAQDDGLHPVLQGLGVCVEIVIDDPAELLGVGVHGADAVLELVDFRVRGAEDRE
jgi:hypothetical protein